MKVRLTSSQLSLVILIVALNIYAITEGFIYGSFWGILLACGSVTALVFCLQILRKLQDLNKQEQEENLVD